MWSGSQIRDASVQLPRVSEANANIARLEPAEILRDRKGVRWHQILYHKVVEDKRLDENALITNFALFSLCMYNLPRGWHSTYR
jgi:hypothetical protein